MYYYNIWIMNQDKEQENEINCPTDERT
eukprot:SAG31_NODE_25248_length_465_cov_0.663934_1_plen_27_part_01